MIDITIPIKISPNSVVLAHRPTLVQGSATFWSTKRTFLATSAVEGAINEESKSVNLPVKFRVERVGGFTIDDQAHFVGYPP